MLSHAACLAHQLARPALGRWASEGLRPQPPMPGLGRFFRKAKVLLDLTLPVVLQAPCVSSNPASVYVQQ